MRVYGGTRLGFSRVVLGQRRRKSSAQNLRLKICTLSLLIGLGFSIVSSTKPVNATATASTLSMTVTSSSLAVSINPSLAGTFGASENAQISVSTNNFSGYTLSVASQSSSSMLFGEEAITSISSITSYSDFVSGAAYKNKWGYKPSKYQQTEQGETSIVTNTSNYLPAPSAGGDVLDVTTTANTTANSYTMSFGAKVDFDIPEGTYTYTYILRAVANPTVYNITYNPNASDGVSSMPTPNPQIVELAGGTDVEHSVATLSSATPTRSGFVFGGWCDVATTNNATTGNQTCSGTTYAPGDSYEIDQTADGSNIMLYAIWNANSYTITFVPGNGESDIVWTNRVYGTEYGTLPYLVSSTDDLEGWYPNTNYIASEKLDPTDTITGDATYYAHWIPTTFPIVWSQMGACEFHGDTGGNITGSECTDYANDRFIDTGIALYSSTNYQNDYEIHFTIDSYNPSGQGSGNSGATFVSDRLSTSASISGSPGVVVKRDSDSILISSKFGSNQKDIMVTASSATDVYIARVNNIIYYSINNGPLIQIQDISSFSQQFGLSTWFGAFPADVNCTEGCTDAKNYLTATLSNMYIRMGEVSANSFREITFDTNGGVANASAGGVGVTQVKSLVRSGNPISEFPADVVKADHVLDGWWTSSSGGTNITTATVPSGNDTYYAHWKKNVSMATLENDVIPVSLNGTDTIVVTNAAEIEAYTFTSNDTTVATVNTTTGEITGVGVGQATITMTGTVSGLTKTITVNVIDGDIYTVHFNAQGGSSVGDKLVIENGYITEIPSSVKVGYTFEGWYTGTNGSGTKLNSLTPITADDTTYYAHWVEALYVCKIARTRHSETCERTADGCYAAGYANGDSIYYGNIVSSSTMASGDAYNCDINADGYFDEETERFYYVTNNGSNAVLTYYKNVVDADYTYDHSLSLLPTSADWTNPSLVSFSGAFDGKVARFLAHTELSTACGATSNLGRNGLCTWAMEKSNFSTTARRDGIWLQTIDNVTRRLHTSTRGVTSNTTANAPRPTIEVPLSLVEQYDGSASEYTITWNTMGGSYVAQTTIDAGDPVPAALPTTTQTNYAFLGWYTEPTGGTAVVGGTTTPSGNVDYYAHWGKYVSFATIQESEIMVLVGSSYTPTVSNAAELEPYTFSSSDTTIATVNSTTGEISGVDEGTATITITGTISNTTKTFEVSIEDRPIPTYRVTYNANGGTSEEAYVDVEQNTAIGDQLVSATRTNYKFFGWYKDSTLRQEVDESTIIDQDMILYAKWIGDTSTFPIVWSQTDACIFNYTTNISGAGCSDYSNKKYIDTGVQLFVDATTYAKDFEIGVLIVDYDSSAQSQSQATIVNSKKESSGEKYPGFVLRKSGSNLDLTEKFNNVGANHSEVATGIHEVRIVRKQGKMWYAYDGAALTQLQDISNPQYFETKVWFGGAVAANGTDSMRLLKGTLTDMYIRVGTYSED